VLARPDREFLLLLAADKDRIPRRGQFANDQATVVQSYFHMPSRNSLVPRHSSRPSLAPDQKRLIHRQRPPPSLKRLRSLSNEIGHESFGYRRPEGDGTTDERRLTQMKKEWVKSLCPIRVHRRSSAVPIFQRSVCPSAVSVWRRRSPVWRRGLSRGFRRGV